MKVYFTKKNCQRPVFVRVRCVLHEGVIFSQSFLTTRVATTKQDKKVVCVTNSRKLAY